MSWSTRENLGAVLAGAPPTPGFFLGAVPEEGFVPVSQEARALLRKRSAETLAAAGVASGSRALVSLNSEGDLAGASLAEALVEVGASAAVVGPRGRMRTLAAMRRLRPDVWITTPTGALDFLARLYLEFNVDPLELELAQILVVGEIPSPGTERRLEGEFESRVTGLYCDPVFGAVWAHGREGRWQVHGSGVLGLAQLGKDVAFATGGALGGGGSSSSESGELVLCPDWSGPLTGTTIRTGQVRGGSDSTAFFSQSVGEHLLIRGRWLSLPLLRRALGQIDGLASHRLAISRGEGTLDKLSITLGFARASLVENPMWAARAREAIAGVTPIEFELATELAAEGAARETIADERGHHLGVDREEVAERLAGSLRG